MEWIIKGSQKNYPKIFKIRNNQTAITKPQDISKDSKKSSKNSDNINRQLNDILKNLERMSNMSLSAIKSSRESINSLMLETNRRKPKPSNRALNK